MEAIASRSIEGVQPSDVAQVVFAIVQTPAAKAPSSVSTSETSSGRKRMPSERPERKREHKVPHPGCAEVNRTTNVDHGDTSSTHVSLRPLRPCDTAPRRRERPWVFRRPSGGRPSGAKSSITCCSCDVRWWSPSRKLRSAPRPGRKLFGWRWLGHKVPELPRSIKGRVSLGKRTGCEAVDRWRCCIHSCLHSQARSNVFVARGKWSSTLARTPTLCHP